MIPKRAIGALLSTVLGLVLLLSFKTPEASGIASSSRTNQAVVDQPVGGKSQSGTSTSQSGSSSTSGGTGKTATGAQGTSGYADGTFTGQDVSMRYGDVQVQVTISDGAVTDVTALQLPNGDGHSSRISSIVEPMLRSEALQAQTASIDLISGATYTSGAYRQSLQSALDTAAG
ncbi:MAG TPA: FMN-binding protein [Patescibacteria group bacterium]|nr:FMN-binding protein [Patescibacteria group bacterium]